MKKHIYKFYGNGFEEFDDEVINESWITINIDENCVFHGIIFKDVLEYFVMGFLLTEGFINSRDEIKNLSINNNIINVILNDCNAEKQGETNEIIPLNEKFKINKETVFKIGGNFDSLGKYYKTTGGVHIAALYNTSGELLFYFEDISRRNAFDKVIGRAIIEEMELIDKILMTSGRMSSDIIKKIARANIPVIASKSAPTDIAIDTGNKLNITVIGFLRGERFNLYTCPERISIT